MLQVAQSTTGGPPFLNSYLEAVNQTFEVGAPLAFAVGTGLSEAAPAGPYIGFAAEAGHNYPVVAMTNKCIVILNTDDITMQSYMKGAQQTDAIVGNTYNLIKDANMGWIVDNTSQGTTGNAIITGIGPYSPLAQLQTVYFRLASTTRTSQGN